MSERACGVRLHTAARLLRWMGRHAVGVCFLLIGVWLFRAVLAGADGISYDWQWYRVWRYLGRWTDGHFIPGPLLDRMELIEVSGYITEEKVEIARKHLLPKELEVSLRNP